MRLTLDDIVKATGGAVVTKPEARSPVPVIITGVTTDTRTLKAGDLFVPLRGPRVDGHRYIADAFARGAAAALCTHPVDGLPARAVLIQVPNPLAALGSLAAAYRRTLPVTVVGVTGSVGKTTTAQMCAAALQARFRVAATREEWNAEIGVPLLLLELDAAHQVAVIEMAMRGPGQLTELVRIAAPRIGVVTNVGEAHLEFLGTREKIAEAKGELIAGLPDDGVAVLNADDDLALGLARLCRGRVVTFGLARRADVTAGDVRQDATGVAFRLRSGAAVTPVRLAAWGRHTVRNALAAAAVAQSLGMAPGDIAAGLAAWVPPKMRLQPIRLGPVLVINDAYNASPASVRAALDVLHEVGAGRRQVAVLGEMRELGAQSLTLHRQVGEDVARREIALLVTVGPEASAIGAGALESGMAQSRIRHAASTADATRLLPALLRAGDVVLIKGSRALEMEHIVAELERALRV